MPISVTSFVHYYTLGCPLYLKRATSDDEDASTRNAPLSRRQQEVVDRGERFEREFVDTLPNVIDAERMSPANVRAALISAPDGTYIYQATFHVECPDFNFQFSHFIPDLVQKRGDHLLAVCDLKSSTHVDKKAYVAQVALYTVLLERWLQSEAGAGTGLSIDTKHAFLWFEGEQQPREYRIDAMRTLLQRCRGAANDLEDPDWLLTPVCQQCPYVDDCRRTALDEQTVSLVPGMSRRRLQELRLLRGDTPLSDLPVATTVEGVAATRAALNSKKAQVRRDDIVSVSMPRYEDVMVLVSVLRDPSKLDDYLHSWAVAVYDNSNKSSSQVAGIGETDFVAFLFEAMSSSGDGKSLCVYFASAGERQLTEAVLVRVAMDGDERAMRCALSLCDANGLSIGLEAVGMSAANVPKRSDLGLTLTSVGASNTLDADFAAVPDCFVAAMRAEQGSDWRPQTQKKARVLCVTWNLRRLELQLPDNASLAEVVEAWKRHDNNDGVSTLELARLRCTALQPEMERMLVLPSAPPHTLGEWFAHLCTGDDRFVDEDALFTTPGLHESRIVQLRRLLLAFRLTHCQPERFLHLASRVPLVPAFGLQHPTLCRLMFVAQRETLKQCGERVGARVNRSLRELLREGKEALAIELLGEVDGNKRRWRARLHTDSQHVGVLEPDGKSFGNWLVVPYTPEAVRDAQRHMDLLYMDFSYSKSAFTTEIVEVNGANLIVKKPYRPGGSIEAGTYILFRRFVNMFLLAKVRTELTRLDALPNAFTD